MVDSDTYKNIIDELKTESKLECYVGDFWNIFDNYDYQYPNLTHHMISIINNKCSTHKRTIIYKLSIYFDLFLKCVELNIDIVNNIEKSDSLEQLMVLNIISMLISKIINIFGSDENPEILNMLTQLYNSNNLYECLDIDQSQQIKKIKTQITKILCNFIFNFI